MFSGASTRSPTSTPGGRIAGRPGRRTSAGASITRSPPPGSPPRRAGNRSTRRSAFPTTRRLPSTTSGRFRHFDFCFSQQEDLSSSSAGLLLGPAARAHRRHAAGLAGGRGHRHPGDRLVHARRPALRLQVPVGAADGPLQHPAARQATRVASRHAGCAAARDRLHGDGFAERGALPPRRAALAVAFLSASQDIVFDAYRADVLGAEERGAGAAVSVLGYRIAMLVSGGLALILVDNWISWTQAYWLMAALMLVGVAATWAAAAPATPPKP